MNKKFLTVAKFEFLETVRKPSFWIVTLFLPLFIGVISYISGSSSIEAEANFRELGEEFKTVFIVDDSNLLNQDFITEPYKIADTLESSIDLVSKDDSLALLYFPKDFPTSQQYQIYYKERESLLAGLNLQGIATFLVYNNGLAQVEDPSVQTLLTRKPSPTSYSVTEDGDLVKDQVEDYILPILSLIVFFLSVFISSNMMLQSVSTEKENRMIETILAIIDKRSLMVGKLVGLIGVVLLQLILWIVLGLLSYYFVEAQMNIKLPIDFGMIDFSMLPINLFFIFTGFLFFSAIMMGTGAVGTGANDSKNLSTVFVMMAVFPMYLLQIFVTTPNSIIAKVLSYFPFTSFMILLIRNSLGALSSTELILGMILSVVYVVVAIWVAIKMFELGCLMYNRRPTLKEAWGALKQR